MKENTNLNSKIWKQAEGQLIEKGLLTKGGLMQDVREVIREKGIWEGMRKGVRKGVQQGMQKGMQKGRQEGRQEGRHEVILNMLKKKTDLSFISEVTGVPVKEIKKLKNGS